MFDTITGESKPFKSIKECATFLGTKQYSVSRVLSKKELPSGNCRKMLYKRYTFEYAS